MNAVLNVISVSLPYIVTIIYFLALFYLIKLILYVMRLPKQLNGLEARIKQLEEKEDM